MASEDTINASSPSSSSSSSSSLPSTSKLLMATAESKFAIVIFSINYASSTWCLAELAKIMEKKKLIVLPIFYHVDPRDVRDQTGDFAVASAAHEERFRDSTEVSLWIDALTEVTNISGWVLNYGNQMLENGSTNWNLPPRFDVTPYESDDADEMVQDYVADLPLIGLENESLSNLSNQMLEDGSANWNLSPRFDVTPDESDDADEMVQDYVADLPLEAHVVPDDVADVPQEDHVVEDHVANLPQEAHVVEDHVANLQQACPICVTNARNMAFLCGHTTCVECGERLDTCHICREPISCRIKLFLG